MSSPAVLPIHVPKLTDVSPVNRVIQSQIGVWPDLDHLIGREIITVRLLPHRSALVLELAGPASSDPARLVIPPYWMVTSSPILLSSLDLADGGISPDGGAVPETREIPELSSLEGSRLTAIESDHEHLDLIFPSLRISVIPEAF